MGKQRFPGSLHPKYVRIDPQSRCLDTPQGGDACVEKRYSCVLHGSKSDNPKFTSSTHARNATFTIVLLIFLFILDLVVFSSLVPMMKEGRTRDVKEEKPAIVMYPRLLKLASNALQKRELEKDQSIFWKEQYPQASNWKPCADKNSLKPPGKPNGSNGFILVTVRGGLSQQRVAVCNAVAIASLLNATLVIPNFSYSNVWKDPSQFEDIYQTEHFINSLSGEVNILKETPFDYSLLDMEVIGIHVLNISKEAKPAEYVKTVLPILLKNGVVHFLGFGNRLGFDPMPSELQRLRCKCNFHALKFVPKIQQVGSVLIKRIRKSDAARNMLDKQLLGNFLSNPPAKEKDDVVVQRQPKYIALHLRFEIDMVAKSSCDFGGGDDERRELEAYRESQFPLLHQLLKNMSVSPTELRELGRCPLTPEEEALVLASLGFKRGTSIYIAGSGAYGGESRMHALGSLYPNLITKETLLTQSELAPFKNFSSQLAALDFIACATADVFSLTDTGSQLSSLVSGFRTYYGGGHAPTLRPHKKRIAAILSEGSTITWHSFEERTREMIQEGLSVVSRLPGKSVYRNPRCPECMCKHP